MTHYVALLYSVYLDKGKRVIMSELREMAADMGLQGVQSVLATGNLLFSAPASASRNWPRR